MLLAQLAINNYESKITEILPFFANYRKYSNIQRESKNNIYAEKAIIKVSKIKKLYEVLAQKISQANQKTQAYINKTRKNGP